MHNHKSNCGCNCNNCNTGCNRCCKKCPTGPTGPTGNQGPTGPSGPGFFFASARVYRAFDLPLQPGPAIGVPFQAVEFDTGSYVDLINFPTRLTALVDGKYDVTAQAVFLVPDGVTEYTIRIRNSNNVDVAVQTVSLNTNGRPTAIANALVRLLATEYVEMFVEFAGIGSPLLGSPLYSPIFSIARVDN